MLTAFMSMDYETTKAMMEFSNNCVEKLIAYFKENHELIIETLASATLGTSYVPAFAR